MISAADFPDVFPCMAGCVERWENEGGRALPPSAAGRPATVEPPASLSSAQCFVPFLALAVPPLAVAALAIVSASLTAPPS